MKLAPPPKPSPVLLPVRRVVLPTPSGHVFSGKSIAEMRGVHMDITVPAFVALRLCPIDYSFYDGCRSREEQVINVRTGASRTLESKHFTGDAADLVPYVDGALIWREAECFHVARAMQTAIRFLGVSLIWGAIWDRKLESLSDDLERELVMYRARYAKKHAATKKKPLFDGVHFERAAA